jgi:hypothetical protein
LVKLSLPGLEALDLQVYLMELSFDDLQFGLTVRGIHGGHSIVRAKSLAAWADLVTGWWA